MSLARIQSVTVRLVNEDLGSLLAIAQCQPTVPSHMILCGDLLVTQEISSLTAKQKDVGHGEFLFVGIRFYNLFSAVTSHLFALFY